MPKKKRKKKKTRKRKSQIQHKPFYADIKPGVPKHAIQIYPSCKINPEASSFSTALQREIEEFTMVLDDPFADDDPWADTLESAHESLMRYLTLGYTVVEKPARHTHCASCRFLDNNPYLMCAVNPKFIDVDNCPHWEQK